MVTLSDVCTGGPKNPPSLLAEDGPAVNPSNDIKAMLEWHWNNQIRWVDVKLRNVQTTVVKLLFMWNVGTHMNTHIHNGDLLEGAAQAGVETNVGPQPFML